MCPSRSDAPPPEFTILAWEQCELGLICLRRRALLSSPETVVTEITLNHEFLMSSLHTDSERALAEHALAMHGGDDLRVLIGGLGLGYTAHEVLKYDRVNRVDVVEFVPQVIDWLQRGDLPLSPVLRGDPRFHVEAGDIYLKLRMPASERYDIIIIDVDHSPDERLDESDSGRFYTDPGLEDVKPHLARSGVLAVWSYAANSPFADALGRCFDDVRTEAVSFDNTLIDRTTTDWLFLARGND